MVLLPPTRRMSYSAVPAVNLYFRSFQLFDIEYISGSGGGDWDSSRAAAPKATNQLLRQLRSCHMQNEPCDCQPYRCAADQL